MIFFVYYLVYKHIYEYSICVHFITNKNIVQKQFLMEKKINMIAYTNIQFYKFIPNSTKILNSLRFSLKCRN